VRDSTAPSVLGSAVANTAPPGTLPGLRQIQGLLVTFSEAMDLTTLNSNTITITDAAGTRATLTGASEWSGTGLFAPKGSKTYLIEFLPAVLTGGQYTFVLSAASTDLFGNLLNQDGDKIPGEKVDDRYTTTFALSPALPPGRIGPGDRDIPIKGIDRPNPIDPPPDFPLDNPTGPGTPLDGKPLLAASASPAPGTTVARAVTQVFQDLADPLAWNDLTSGRPPFAG
jgi:hypothetical protein